MLQQTSLRAFSLFHILFQIEYGANLIFAMKFIFQLSVRKRVAKNIHENKGNNQFDSCQEPPTLMPHYLILNTLHFFGVF